MGQTILYKEINQKIQQHIMEFSPKLDMTEKIDMWLRPIVSLLYDNAIHFEVEGEDCWVVEKEEVLNTLFCYLPSYDNLLEKHYIFTILEDIWDFVIDYQD